MDLVSTLSAPLWDLLQRTRLRPDVVLDLFDESLKPLFPVSADERAAALRRIATIRFYAGTEASFRTVLQSGREARITIEDWDVVLLPLRDAGCPVAMLASIARRGGDEQAGNEAVESPARAWRDAIEADLAGARRLQTEEQAAHRARALARFIVDLQQCEEESELLKALLQAVAVWHDVEPCVYHRDLAGRFTLRAALPGTDISVMPESLEASTVANVTAGEDTRTWPILRQLGWAGGTAPRLMLVSSGSLEEWLFALSGAGGDDRSEQLQPLLQGFSAGMERVRERQGRRLRQQLWEAIVNWPDAADVRGLGNEVLRIAAQAVDATHGLLIVSDHPGGLVPGGGGVVALGALVADVADAARTSPDGSFTAGSLSLTFPLTGGRTGSLELRRGDRDAFRASHATVLLSIRPLLGAWLSGLREIGAWEASFAIPDSPRVLRFADPQLPSART